MLRRLLLLWVIILTACTNTVSATPTPTRKQVEAEQQVVYAALLASTYPSELIVVMNHTAVGLSEDDIEQNVGLITEGLSTLAPETLDDFNSRNDRSYPLPKSLNIGIEIVPLSQQEMNDIFSINQNGWEIFYRRYPEAPGIITLSRVGFNESLDQALVYLGIQRNWKSGTGNYFLLEKENEIWVVREQVLTWTM